MLQFQLHGDMPWLFSWFLFQTHRRGDLIGLVWVSVHPWVPSKPKAAEVHVSGDREWIVEM